ncbi:MAG TPA: sterol desaturase family protein [Novosphingobium sp.]|nr:sterol desaturase family protein [Novosphingobium sp.]
MISPLRAMQPHAGLADFAALAGLVLAGILVVLAATAIAFRRLNARAPHNRIQPDRQPLPLRRELMRAPVSILVIALFFAGGLFCQWQGWALAPVALRWWNAGPLLLLSILLYDAWFYWVHRLLHTRALLRFHAPHHRAHAPTVWTNHNETPVEAVLNQLFYLLIVFVVPIPWPVLVAHKLYDQFSGMMGHCGFEHFASPMARAPWPLASTVFHDNHHRYFHHNFGHSFTFWDRALGTLHPDYDKAVRQFEPEGS